MVTRILERGRDGRPTLWLEKLPADLLRSARTVLMDERASIPFDPETDDLDAAIAQWKASFGEG